MTGEFAEETESPLPTWAHVCARLADETASLPHGLAVPTPMLPFARTVRSVEVAVPAVVEAMVKSGVLAAVVREFDIERSE